MNERSGHAPQEGVPGVTAEREIADALRRGIEQLQGGRLAEAQAEFRRVLSVAPRQPNALHLLGLVAYHEGDDRAAGELMRAALAIKSDYAAAHSNLGLVLQREGRLDEAAASFRAALAIEPALAEVHNNLGTVLQEQGRLDEAAASFRQALALQGEHAMASFNLGNVLRLQRRPDEALAMYRDAARIRPDYLEAHGNLGNLLLEQGRPDEAAASFRCALELAPELADLHNGLGIALRELSQFDAAAACFRRAIGLRPGDEEAHNNLGAVLRQQGDPAAAVASYRRALAINPHSAATHTNLGNALKDQGLHADAVASYQEAIRLAPAYAEAHKNLGNALKDQGRTGEAIEAYRAALALDPGLAEAKHMLDALTGAPSVIAPQDYVVTVFDRYADHFERHLVQALGYDAPQRLLQLLLAAGQLPAPPWTVLDLGCGTGLVGAVLDSRAQTLVGVDLSPKMLARAGERGCYDRLEQSDVLKMMRAEPATAYDVIAAADLFIYMGRLDDVAMQAKRLLRPGGCCVFSAECLEDVQTPGAEQDYRLLPTGRYAHSESYLRRLAAANALTVRAMVRAPIRRESDRHIHAWLTVWQA